MGHKQNWFQKLQKLSLSGKKQLWKKYIQWEKSNPLKTEDNSIVAKRGICLKMQSLLSCD